MNDFEKISKKLKKADCLIVGASNGLSITEGLHLFADNDDFDKNFRDFKEKYKISNILQGMFAS